MLKKSIITPTTRINEVSKIILEFERVNFCFFFIELV